jgi:AcrR family transcriptional regulator
MRITARAREETHARIVAEARRLFAERGFHATTTRELAAAAGIAAGTLFNYFKGKEELASWLVARAAAEGSEAFRAGRRAGAGLEEELFAHVAEVLRALEPCRPWLVEALESAQSPLRWTGGDAATEDAVFRAEHLEVVSALLADHGHADAAGPVTLHLYWSLLLGALAFWARDESPHREQTLALLDRSLRLFARAAREPDA